MPRCHSPGGTVCCRFRYMSFTKLYCLLYMSFTRWHSLLWIWTRHSPNSTVCCIFGYVIHQVALFVIHFGYDIHQVCWRFGDMSLALFVVDLGTCHSPGGTVCCIFGYVIHQVALFVVDLGICHSPGGTVCCRFWDMSFTRWHCLL